MTTSSAQQYYTMRFATKSNIWIAKYHITPLLSRLNIVGVIIISILCVYAHLQRIEEYSKTATTRCNYYDTRNRTPHAQHKKSVLEFVLCCVVINDHEHDAHSSGSTKSVRGVNDVANCVSQRCDYYNSRMIVECVRSCVWLLSLLYALAGAFQSLLTLATD